MIITLLYVYLKSILSNIKGLYLYMYACLLKIPGIFPKKIPFRDFLRKKCQGENWDFLKFRGGGQVLHAGFAGFPMPLCGSDISLHSALSGKQLCKTGLSVKTELYTY